MNLEPRIMIMIFRAQNEVADIRQAICKFNIYYYISFIMIYPILIFTNFNEWLFIGLSLIFIPQIYVNGIHGQRPHLTEPYYRKFLLSRFLVIVLLA